METTTTKAETVTLRYFVHSGLSPSSFLYCPYPPQNITYKRECLLYLKRQNCHHWAIAKNINYKSNRYTSATSAQEDFVKSPARKLALASKKTTLFKKHSSAQIYSECRTFFNSEKKQLLTKRHHPRRFFSA